MRVALVADLHGNAVALEAVLADIQRQGVDATVCLGDLATLGPQPRPVLERLRDLHIPWVLGNHDAALLHPDQAPALHIAPSVIETVRWCHAALAPEDFEFLRSGRPTLQAPLGGDADLLCFHGSPQSNVDLITATTPASDLDRMLAGQDAAVLAGGHAHVQMLRQHHGRLVLNPGSVGAAFNAPTPDGASPSLLPWAEYAVVTWEAGAVSADFRRVPFDIEAFLAELARSDLPLRDWWRQQYAR